MMAQGKEKGFKQLKVKRKDFRAFHLAIQKKNAIYKSWNLGRSLSM